jgi:hypothetical protein
MSYLRDVFTGVTERVKDRAKEEAMRRVDRLAPDVGPAGPVTSPAVRPPLRPVPIPQPEPPWPAKIRLQGGREIRGTFLPAMAARRDLVALGQACAENDRRAFGAIRRHEKTIRQLKQANDELTARVAALEEQAGQTISRLMEELRNLEDRFRRLRVTSQESLTTARTARTMAARQQVELQSLARTAQIQNISSVISNAQASAYGEKGHPFKGHNLFLVGNQLFWSFFDPLLRAMDVVRGPETSAAAWLSPIGSLATGQLALANRQNVRFISGTDTFDGRGLITRSLRDKIADSYWQRFQGRTDVPVSVLSIDPVPARLSGEVRDGVLIITRNEVAPLSRRVSWIVDTGADGG